MATSGALADFTRMPPERKALVFIVIAVLLGLLYFQFVYKSLDRQLSEAQAQKDAAIATSAQQTVDIPKYAQARTRMKKLKEDIEANQKALPTEAELPAFYETLNRKINESGVELSNWAQLPEQPVETFVKVPINIEITGTFLQLKRFFASLVQKNVGPARSDDAPEDRDRIVSIENLALSSPAVKNGAIVLTAKFVAATFRQADPTVGSGSGTPPGAPGAPPPAAGTAPAAPPPPTPGSAAAPPPPMPSAATPAGAKARVENSLDKGANRDANATGVDEAKTPGGAGSARLKGGM